MKKIIAIILAVLMTAAMFAGCNGTNNNETSSDVPASSEAPTSSEAPVSSEESVNPQDKLDGILASVKNTYGEDYLPSMALDSEMLCDMYGLDASMIEAFVGETVLISAQIDRFIGIKAVDGKGADIKAALEKFHEEQKQNLAWYPMNAARTEAAKIIAHGDYVFYVILGAYPEDTDSEDEAAQLEFAENEIKKAVDVINAAF